jgi:hypothetical protein
MLGIDLWWCGISSQWFLASVVPGGGYNSLGGGTDNLAGYQLRLREGSRQQQPFLLVEAGHAGNVKNA